MGIWDHRKTWHFSVGADDEQCLLAFHQAMTRPGFKLLIAKWELERDTISVDKNSKNPSRLAYIATYKGRGGILGVVTELIGGRIGERTRDEIQQAIGYSQIIFAINPDSSESRTQCSMWLSKFSTNFGFTTDAHLFRSSMRSVEKQLRILDPMLTVNKE